MILFSDVHLREESAEIVLGEVLPGILDACVASGEKELACLGDLYHFRYRVDVRIQNALREWLLKATGLGISVYLLPGNHDQVDFEGRNALEVFSDIPGVRVFTEPTWTKHGLWVPYRKRQEDIAQALTTRNPGVTVVARTLFLHHGLQGAMMNNHLMDSEGLPSGMFAAWHRVLCGHYHKRQDLLGAVTHTTYIGSPWQTKADEAGQPKGYAHWDGKILRFVDTHWGPRYHNVALTAGHTFDVSGIAPGDTVRVTTAAGLDPAKVGAFLSAHNVRGIVTPEVQVAEARISLPDGSDLGAYAQAYVDLAQIALDKTRLMRVFQEITQ